ncbi:sulfite exporter TauE/SafE family protein [Glutamicibacter sp. NPDC087344]|uniref:sulfite exporter TauE/SafE family protein n=1 Tax=Glutamicibacter sp. NPDC087344 TaxID=3363994 RepID=UPI00381BEADB
MGPAEYVILAVTLFAAAGLQGSIGFGAGLVAAPVVGILEPSLLPAFIICLGALIGLLVTLRERASVDVKGASWALLGRIPGSMIGTWLVVLLPLTALTWAVALSVLAGIAASFIGWRPVPHRRALVTAGALSGIMGTATATGGAPMAIIWQGQEPARVRGTMSAFFLVGSVISVLLLALAGQVSAQMLTTLLWMSPVVVAGFFLSRWINKFMDARRLRYAALGVSILGSLVLIIRLLIS